MAEVIIDLDLRGLRAVHDVYGRLERLVQNPAPLLSDLGEYLTLSTDERFDRHEAPDGTPWAAVSDEYADRKLKGRATKRSGAVTDPTKVLELTRDLRRLLRYSVEADQLILGSDRPYAGRHQKNRPFLGISKEDEAEIGRLVIDHISDAFTGRP